MSKQVPTHAFGPFELRIPTRELYKYGVKLKLRPQPLQILQMLLEHSGDAVTREELRKALWVETTFVDFEHGLNNSIKELRRVLGDSAAEPRYIETLPRVGYRFIASVQRDESAGDDHVVAMPTPPPTPELPATSGPQQRWGMRWLPAHFRLLVAVTSLMMLAAAVYLMWWSSLHPSHANTRVVLAVLPFENLTGDSGQDYLSDGLTEELISQLGQADSRRLGVIGRASVMHYKGGHESLQEIGRALQVQYAVEGNVRRDSGRVSISARLVDMRGRSLWSGEYDKDTTDLLAIQQEIAQQISNEVRLRFGGSESSAPAKTAAIHAVSTQAHDLYLRGTYFLNKRDVAGLRQAVSCFQQAVTIDPGYASAHAALANSYALLSSYSGGLQAQYMPKAKQAALRALELDGNLPEAHVALAVIAQNYDWDWQAAEREYRLAIQLNPNYATAHHWYAEHLAYRGRFREALAESELARQIEPLSMIIAADRGVILYYARQFDDSIKQFAAVREMEPNFVRAGMIVYPMVEKQLYSDALKIEEQAHRIYGENAWYWSNVAYVAGRSGRQKDAHRALRQLKQLNRRRPFDPGILLLANLAIGDREQAFFWMEKAYTEHSCVLASLKVEPAFDPVRADPRFQDMLQRLRLDR
ncbi:MAG TPA: winged helix-turn-helix domain-containing protein [Terriglobales bacterium]|jgi:TolB-like protein/DNA-binding winged helix-turn-helix (wHTH) protein|nr:winged helix-turn-helix domain-containing protein [Terriglobales bacterium]